MGPSSSDALIAGTSHLWQRNYIQARVTYQLSCQLGQVSCHTIQARVARTDLSLTRISIKTRAAFTIISANRAAAACSVLAWICWVVAVVNRRLAFASLVTSSAGTVIPTAVGGTTFSMCTWT